jgi:CheY-like chemotaxis protein
MVPRDSANPLEALDWIRRGDPFDPAILDVMMPEMDGVSLAAAIREQRDDRALPLIFFPSLGRQESGARWRSPPT